MRSIDERITEAELKLEKAREHYERLLAEKSEGRSIRDRMQRVMKEKGLSYEEIGNRMGVSRQYAHQLIAENKYCTPKNVGRIAQALGVTTDYLIYGKDDKNV